ncbi:hypothetical protein HN51_020346 [Arachis hypogaea]|uniref:Enhancer of polycomb-like protein n=1 Tax=Arachis hypogaea TaxID=3818 RepID=A0A445C0M2_ARAHY|nr:uncharacterized protein LOC112707812 isoform X1 [Arachis hypogaea]QHO32285.1 uncharacterized protein DS421_8g248530 [Arachis hypogaea]RYR44461.1 hypothetical protein Ahy_A08g040787 [Arachis hypogaea]
MEDREGNSHGAAIPKKSRSLDLKSLYKSKVTNEAPEKNLKRKGSNHGGGGDEKRSKKKRSRKELPLSSLENADGCIKKVVDEESHKGPGSSRQDLCEHKLEAKQGLSSSSGINRHSLILSDGPVCIPKRKRDFVGRKKFEVRQAPSPAGQPSGRSCNGDQLPKLSIDDLDRGVESSKTKQKDVDEIKESRSCDSNSVQHFKGKEESACHSAVNSGDSSLKRPRRKDRKRKALASDRIRVAKEAEPLIDSSKISDHLREDDEANLEENAARMLSSRFDPNCTGLSFLLPSSRNISSHGSKSPGSESASVDTANRVLRPRKLDKEKGSSRKRRHFYEILLGDLDPDWVLNQRIKVFWPLDQSWYYGLVDGYDKESKLHHIKYDDRDQEWVNLQTERFKLLLFPSEVRREAGEKRTVKKSMDSDAQKGSKSRKERQVRDDITEDDSCGENCMDTEPIISWLARSSHRVKSSALHGIKKHRSSGPLPGTASSFYDEPVKVQGCSTKSYLREGKGSISSGSVSHDKLGDNLGKKSSLQSANCHKDGKQPIVYVRTRRRPTSKSPLVPKEMHANMNASCSIVREPFDRSVETKGPLRLTYSEGVTKLWLDTGSAAFKFDFNFPIRSVLNDSFRSDNLWLVRAVLLLRYGTVITMWPRVHLEMLFVDNVFGLRFLLFEGCSKMAAAFVFWVLRVFNQPVDQGEYIDLELPVTSIRFRFSSVHVIKKPLVFAFYNFSRVENSKWMYLDSKLKKHCLLSKQLHLSECTYDNIQALQNGTSGHPVTAISGQPSTVKIMRKRTRPGINIMGVSREFTRVDTHQSSDAGKRKVFPFSLSFAAAPTFFLSLHLKLLMEQSVAHISFCDKALVDAQEDSGLKTDGCSERREEFNLDKVMMTSSKDVVCDGLVCAKSNPIICASDCSGGILSQNQQNIGLSDDRTSGCNVPERPAAIQLPRWQSDHSDVCTLPSSSLPDEVKADDGCSLSPTSLTADVKANDGSHSFRGNLSVKIPSVDHFEKSVDGDLHYAQHSSDFSWNINGGVIQSPNPTAPRSSWHQNKTNSTLGFKSHGWSDGKVDSLQNGFSNGPKKPRTQVSYSVPFAGYDFGSRHRGHQKGLPHKRIRKANDKKPSDVARGPEKNLESLSCDANVLITLGDKGWREYGAQVVLELFDHNEWKLSVKLAGVTRYSYKAHQFLQTGSTNRYTHAMMWKGGKDWVLEFPDRSQWALFKEMHEECYNRNIRAASVKNIPIPGVILIEENDGHESEASFVRSSKYFRQVETDVDMALNSSNVLYDMDSEDEQWILTLQNSEKDNYSMDGISEEIFEKTIDRFEKAAYAQKQDQFTPIEIEELMVDVATMPIAKTIYEYWQQKRQKRGMALIRHFQPPQWERYHQQLREWEVAMSKNNIPHSNGCLDKFAPLEKPPMFAFCLKPRGLEVPNKGSKQRSQKRISVSGHANSIMYEHDGFHTPGRRLNGFAFGDERISYPGHNYDSLDDSPLPQSSLRGFSPRDAGSVRYYFMNNGGFDRKYTPKHHRNKPRNMYHNDSHMISDSPRLSGSGKRNGVNQWNMGYYDMMGHRKYPMDGPQGHDFEQLDGSDLDEFKLRDASGAARHAHNMARLKRERAQRLLYRADLAIHRAVAALMTAEAIKASEDSNGDG